MPTWAWLLVTFGVGVGGFLAGLLLMACCAVGARADELQERMLAEALLAHEDATQDPFWCDCNCNEAACREAPGD